MIKHGFHYQTEILSYKVVFAVPSDHSGEMKEGEQLDKCFDVARELQNAIK